MSTGGPVVQVQNWGDAIFASISNTIYILLAAIPLIIGAIVILAIGWILSNIAARLTKAVFERAGADRIFGVHGRDIYGDLTRQWPPSRMAAEIVRWLIRLVFLNAAANVLGLTQISVLLNAIVLWIPNLVVAAVILLVTPLIARFVRGTIEVGAGEMGFTNGRTLGQLAYAAIVALDVIVAVNQIGIAANLVDIVFIGFVAALAIGFGLAFGLGGRDVAAQITQQWYASSQEAARRIAERANAPQPTRGPSRRPAGGREWAPSSRPSYAAVERTDTEMG